MGSRTERVHGTLTSWDDDRGFGFITAAQGSDKTFVHIKSLPTRPTRPQLGEALSFERLRLDTGVPKRELETTLERLEAEGVIRSDARRYTLARDPDEISLGSIFKAVQGDRAR